MTKAKWVYENKKFFLIFVCTLYSIKRAYEMFKIQNLLNVSLEALMHSYALGKRMPKSGSELTK